MYLIDTNVISELRKRHKAEPRVIAWFKATPEIMLHISVVTIAELEAGVRSLERKDPSQVILLRRWFEGVVEEFRPRILPVDLASAQICSGLHIPGPRPDRDAWIAATALAKGLTVVTRNLRDFHPMGVKCLNPWDA
jgi:toxin FitB